MSFLLRVVLPDRPGMLGAVATALGAAGADITSVDIVERGSGFAVDDLVIDLPPGKLADSLLTAATSVSGVAVESIRPYSGTVDTHRELELVESMAADPHRSMELLTQSLPRIFRASWALEIKQDDGTTAVGAAGASAPDMTDVTLPWLPLARATVLDADAEWVPSSWKTLGTELAAAPIGGTKSTVLIGRTGGPPFRHSEVLRLAHLVGIAVTVVEHSR